MSANQDSEETHELLARIEAGEPGAIDRLLARDRDLIRRIAELRMDNALAARLSPSDVVQEAQLQVARRLKDYLQHRAIPYRAWLRRIALETILRLRREQTAAKRDVRREAVLPTASSMLVARELAAREPSPLQAAIRAEQLDRLHAGILQLSESEQEVLLMRTVEGLSNQEVAQALDISESLASKRYGRALLSLDRLLRGEGQDAE